MEEKINLEIAKHQDELNKLETAIQHIAKAGEVSNEVLEAIRGVESQYGTNLTQVIEKYNEYLDKAHETYTKQLADVEGITETHKQQIEQIQKFIDTNAELIQHTDKLAESIENVNFPKRLDKIVDTVESMKEDFSNTQSLILSSEESLKAETAQIFEHQQKELASMKNMVIALIVIAAGLGVNAIVQWFM